MSDQEKRDLREKFCRGLAFSYEKLLRQKAALKQDMVIADENGQPLIVPAQELLAIYESGEHVRNTCASQTDML